ncbi:MAG: HupE/UreJ family protein, partial [Gammaproteobacteria bacterium]
MKLRLLLILCLSLGLLDAAQADIVKPALVEISANTKGEVNIEVRASIEALLTGINARYKNTQDAPTAEEYDELRVLQADQLAIEFEPFKQEFLDQIFLKVDGTPVTLEIV